MIGIFIGIFFIYLALNNPVGQQMLLNLFPSTEQVDQTTPENEEPPQSGKPESRKTNKNPAKVVPIPQTSPPDLK